MRKRRTVDLQRRLHAVAAERRHRISDERDVVAELHPEARGGLDARVRDHADEDDVRDPALRELGIRQSDRVATLAWNSHRHLELYFAAPSIGAVLHTINFRLSREHLLYIINHAQDRVIFVDRSVAALVASLQPELPGVEHYVVMDDHCQPPPALPHPAIDYEELLAAASERADYPALDEKMASAAQ